MSNVTLSCQDQQRRAALEALIDQHLNDFIRVAAALAEIKRDRLWRNSHPSFEAFSAEKFDKGRSYGYELAAAGEILAHLQQSGIPDSDLPASASQIRALSGLQPSEQVEAVQVAQAIAVGKPTAIHANRAAEAVKTKLQSPQPGQKVTVLDESSPYYGQQVEVVASQGVIVQATIAPGEVKPFLSNEVSGSHQIHKPVASAQKPKVDRVEALEVALEVERLRALNLEGIIRRLTAAARSGTLTEELLNEAETLIA
jgi:hypothetical protein